MYFLKLKNLCQTVACIVLISATFTIFLNAELHAQEASVYHMDTLTVKGNAPQRSLALTGSDRTVISRSTIETLGARSITELLDMVSSVKLSQRGSPGSQTDISIRGSSYDGVLVLVDGVRVHDPQTGHFALDLPYTVSAVEQIEILSGGGSGKYGASASGGIINIVTRKNGEDFSNSFSGGSYGTGETSASIFTQKGSSSFGMTYHGLRTDGYRKGSDSESSGVTLAGSSSGTALALNWNGGLIKKRFGASDFYAPYPSYENTMTLHGTFNASYATDDSGLFRVRMGARGHEDDFILIRNNPSVYRNTHYNRSITSAVEYLSTFSSVELLVGAESERFGISSGSLGGRSDMLHSAYGELSSKIADVDMSFSMRYSQSTRGESVFLPGIGLSLPLGSSARIRMRAERLHRPPTYTELYYTSPANAGNPDLVSETSDSMELGADVFGEKASASLSLFARRGRDVIDWIRSSEMEPWLAENHGSVDTQGIEGKSSLKLPAEWLATVGATILDQNVREQKGIESKYALTVPDRVASLTVTGPISSSMRAVLSVRYENGGFGGERSPVMIRLMKNVGRARLHLTGSNLFNERYYDFPGLPSPGRWISAGIDFTMDKR